MNILLTLDMGETDYNLAGNRLRKTDTATGAVDYTLGVGDRLATLTGCAYEYNAAGTFRHVYDDVQCIADLDESGAVVRSYVWGPGIDNLLAVRSGGATYYALTDHQNTVHGFVDSSGARVAQYVYDAWGNVLESSISVSSLAGNRYLFQGREYSWATGLYNFRARWYDPATGRWLSKDPIGISGGMNFYLFCSSSPVNWNDAFGLLEDGNRELEKVRIFYDAIDMAADRYWWVPKGASKYLTLFSLSGGIWGPLDYKFHNIGPFLLDEKIVPGDYFGNYIAGYQAGYGNTAGLLFFVKFGGVMYSILSDEQIGDAESRPAIINGYKRGVKDRGDKK